LVVVDSPKTAGGWGNENAGPVFNSICMEAARHLGIPSSEIIDFNREKGTAKKFVSPSVEYAAEVKSRSDKRYGP